jgi:gamma-glutamyl:cysteine ligase YbdK (ATP-grasp superfamily)
MSRTAHLQLFGGYGIEAEYMIVHRETLAVLPIADKVLEAAVPLGGVVNSDDLGEVEFADTAWSNELVLHVVEMKTNGPITSLRGLHNLFQRDVERINKILQTHDAMLMPTAMHPFMMPLTDTKLWPHGDAAIYAAFNKIFDCRGHGWSNLQSIHINLPFVDDEEFGKLHAAIRLVLPILPALAASSPVYEGKPSGLMDSRLEFYRHNQRKIPLITGDVIPEPAYTRDAYNKQILQRLYAQIKEYDPAGILQNEWLNSRGAIARFDRNAIEIRVLDIQESPLADLAVISTVVSLVKSLVEEKWLPLAKQMLWSTEPLAEQFVACLRAGGQAVIEDPAYLRLFGMDVSKGEVTAGKLWRRLVEVMLKDGSLPLKDFETPLMHLLEHGCLSRRILKALGPAPAHERINDVYRQLCDTLGKGGLFHVA